MEEIERLKRRLSRERAARKEAENLLEEKSRALFQANNNLLKARDELEERVQERTEELREHIERFGRFIESAADIIYQTDSKGYLTYANPVALNTLKLTPHKEIIGLHFTELVDSKDQKRLQRFYTKQLKSKERDTYCEFRLNTKDSKKEMWIGQSVQLVFQDDTITGIQAVARNITDRKNVEHKLTEQKDFAQQILSNMGQGLTLCNAENYFVYVNPEYARLLGYTPDELVGKAPFDFLRIEDIQAFYEARMSRKKGFTSAYEVRLIAKDGRQIPVLMTGTTRWHKEEAIGYIDTITDLTERKQTEEVLRSARNQAVEASRLKSEFLANMSHEIRTPLNGIIGMTELLADSELDEEQQEFLEIISTSGSALLSIINEILDFSKIAERKIELEHQPFNLRETIENSLDMLASSASQKQLELAYDMSHEIPNLAIGDAVRLRQVLINLLSNAVKFTTTGEVIITVANTKGLNGRKQLQFSVRDTGIGIPLKAQRHLFRAFNQVDSSTTRKYGGTGLGLAISKELCHLMGGDIWLDSKEGQGTTFHFTINLETPTNLTPSPPPVSPHLLGKQVLIVDDNATQRKILLRKTKLWGMQGKAVASGLEALSLLRKKNHFDLAIIDMEMPNMTGKMLATEIRCLKEHVHMPLISLSSLGQKQTELPEDLFTGHVTKPIKEYVLYQAIESACTWVEQAGEKSQNNNQIKNASDSKLGLKILLAEDNFVNKKVVTSMLARLGYTADTVDNGREAVAALAHQTYDLILMDIQMPEMDGLEATNYIRQNLPPDEQPFIVALTASAIQGDRERFIASGMNEYISKPLHTERLATLLQDREDALRQQQMP